jgi:hypothetical protein
MIVRTLWAVSPGTVCTNPVVLEQTWNGEESTWSRHASLPSTRIVLRVSLVISLQALDATVVMLGKRE